MSEEKKYAFGVHDEARNASSQSNNRTNVFLGTSLVFVSIALLGAVVGLVYQYIMFQNKQGSISVICQPQELVERFPGFFKTSQQQVVFLESVKTVSLNIPTENRTVCPSPSYYNSERRQSGRLRRQINPDDTDRHYIYHACCRSEISYEAPSEAPALNGEMVEIVQTDDLKQIFRTESCQPDPACSLCECFQPEPFINKAVVYKDKNAASLSEKYEIAEIKMLGCCKCLNVALN